MQVGGDEKQQQQILCMRTIFRRFTQLMRTWVQDSTWDKKASSSRRGQNASADKDRRSENGILKNKMSTGSEDKARRKKLMGKKIQFQTATQKRSAESTE